MKAIVYEKYGFPEVLRLEEVARPAPKDNEVLIKIYAAGVNAGDWILLRGKPFPVRVKSGILKPKHKILGTDVAGRVEAVGKNVKQLQTGDDVFGNLSVSGYGAFAEYVCVPENMVVPKPINITFEEAACVPSAAVTALQGLRNNGHIQSGQKVLINGASGGVGMYAVQIAKSFGAEVTGVCSTRNIDVVRQVGADHVIDYTQEDFTKSGRSYDLILAANGYHPILAYKRSLSPKGIYVTSGGSGVQMTQAMLFGPLISMFGKKKMGNFIVKPNIEDLHFVRSLLEQGKLRPVVEMTYQLNETAEAIQYVGQGHAKGKVVITIIPESKP